MRIMHEKGRVYLEDKLLTHIYAQFSLQAIIQHY